MQASSVIALLIGAVLVGAVLGLGVGALRWRDGRAELERAARRLTATRQRLEATEGDRLALSGQARELQRALRAERSLLDGVAARSGIASHDVRRALARDVLHRADPYRAWYEREPLEVDRRASVLTTMKLGTRTLVDISSFGAAPAVEEFDPVDQASMELVVGSDATTPGRDETIATIEALRAELDAVRAELVERSAELVATRGDAETLAGLLAADQRRLAEARSSITRLRSRVEHLIDAGTAHGSVVDLRGAGTEGLAGERSPGTPHWSDVPQRLASLHGEVASLRSRIADRALAGDQMTARQAELDRLLGHVVNELERLRLEVQASRRGT